MDPPFIGAMSTSLCLYFGWRHSRDHLVELRVIKKHLEKEQTALTSVPQPYVSLPNSHSTSNSIVSSDLLFLVALVGILVFFSQKPTD